MTDVRTVPPTESLSPEVLDAVRGLVDRAAEQDGFTALNEAASLRLRYPDPGTTHFLIREAGQLAGYGQTHAPAGDPDAGPGGPPAQGALVVHPDERRRGLGTRVLKDMLGVADRGLVVWATRNTAAAQALAARVGLIGVRQLLIMSRTLAGPVAQAPIPSGVQIRAFVPHQDEEAWLAVNAAAFATHLEQGKLTRSDLDQRMAEPWFDPADFLVAERAGALIGFHWTKQRPGRPGEVYVLGVDPDAGVRGLGRALLTAGLEHLRRAGNTAVELYVDADNTRAVALYEGSGFTIAGSDVMYASPNSGVRPLATMHLSSAPTGMSQEKP